MRSLAVCILSCSLQLFGQPDQVQMQADVGQPELSGSWKSDSGVLYSIEKSVTGYVWRADKLGEKATLWFLGPGRLRAVWSGSSGEGAANGYIVSSSQGHATEIVWDSGVLFEFQEKSVAGIPSPEPDLRNANSRLPEVPVRGAPGPRETSSRSLEEAPPAPSSPQRPLVHTCQPEAVAAFPDRIQVRCTKGQGIIVDQVPVENFGFATSNPDKAGRVLSILLTAVTEGKSVAIHYYKGRQEASQIGCRALADTIDCLQMWAVELRR